MKRGKPLSRRKPLRAKSPAKPSPTPAQLKRTPLPKTNPKRRAKRWAEQFDSPEFLDFVHALPCAVCEQEPSEAAHARSRGAGGKAADILPLCGECHELQHTLGVKSFESGERPGLPAHGHQCARVSH